MGGCAVTVLPGTGDIFRARYGIRHRAYRQGTSGTLGVTFAGTAPGTGFGRLDASGVAVRLAGRLLLGTSGGFSPPLGKPFEVLRYAARNGKSGKLSGRPAYPAHYLGTGMDVVFR